MDLRVFKDVFISMFAGTRAFMGDILSVNLDGVAFAILEPFTRPGLV